MTSRDNLKVVLLGASSIGKTCLAKRYLYKQYMEQERATVMGACDSKIFTRGDKEYQMIIWDTCGQEKYQAISTLYYRSAKAAIICYDVSLVNTYQSLQFWIKQLQSQEPKCRIYICATKCDLLDRYEANPRLSLVESYAAENEAKFFLTSSRTGENVENVFEEILEDYISSTHSTPEFEASIRLSNHRMRFKRRKKNCCVTH